MLLLNHYRTIESNVVFLALPNRDLQLVTVTRLTILHFGDNSTYKTVTILSVYQFLSHTVLSLLCQQSAFHLAAL